MTEILKLEGLADAKAALDALAKDMRRKVVRGALRDAARPIVQQARANAPVRTGLVKKRIAVATSKIKRGSNGEIGVYIRPSATRLARKNKLRAQDPWYYKFQEAGFHAVGRSSARGRGKNRAERTRASGARFIPGKAFMGRAFESRRDEALAIFQARIKKRIEQANQRKR